MDNTVRWLIIGVLLFCAAACYLIGSAKGIGFFLVAGVLFELAFWLKIIRFNRRT